MNKKKLYWNLRSMDIFTSVLIVTIFTCFVGCQEVQPKQILVELMGGVSKSEGRVEVVNVTNGVRGTVCSDGWDDLDAAVVCRMLGYSGRSTAVNGGKLSPTRFGPGRGTIFLRSVNCNGNEKSILDCPLEGWEINICGHNEDAGVVCQDGSSQPASTTTTTPLPKICSNPNGNVVLERFDGKDLKDFEGVVMYQTGTKWAGICNERWGQNEAAVVCRMLCYNPLNARAIISKSQFGNFSSLDQFAFSYVICNGNESDLKNCSTAAWTAETACDVTEAAAVSCWQPSDEPLKAPIPVIDCKDNNKITAGFSVLDEPMLQKNDVKLVNADGSSISEGVTFE